MTRECLPGRPVVEIPHGIELPTDADFEVRARFGLPLQLLFVGRLIEAKGVLLLPDILRNCVDGGLDCCLKVVGEGQEEQVLRERFAAMGLEKQVEFLGPVPPQCVNSYLLSAHLLLFPSYSEGLGMILLRRRLAAACPLLHS